MALRPRHTVDHDDGFLPNHLGVGRGRALRAPLRMLGEQRIETRATPKGLGARGLRTGRALSLGGIVAI
eukprot:6609350-Pyramimonas_sp.AAC.1